MTLSLPRLALPDGVAGALQAVPAAAWPDLVHRARWEGLAGLLYATARREGVDLPGQVASEMAAEHVDLCAANLASLGGLQEILAAAGSAGLEPLVLPGASLLDLYPDVGCRPMDDVDLLVRDPDLDGVADLLRGLGYAPAPGHPRVFCRSGSTVDVHTDLVNGARLSSRRLAAWMDVAEVWQRRRAWDLGGGQRAWSMGREDELLYTCAHALRHSYRRLAWFCDVARLAALPLDWTLVGAGAERYNLSRPLAYAGRYLESEAGVALPAGASAAGQSSTGALEERLLGRLFRERGACELGEVLWAFSCRGWVARSRFLSEFLFPRPRVLRQVFPRVPGALVPLVYLLRLGQVCRRGGAALVGLVKG